PFPKNTRLYKSKIHQQKIKRTMNYAPRTYAMQNQRQAMPSSQTTSPTGMMVYPNPAQHTMNVNYNYGKNVATDGARRIVVYDLTGKAVITQAVNDATGTMSIPVDALAGAVYMVRMEQNGRAVQIQRVSITH
ncbi:MAG: T9SS type A sorting domain-containing protein, partial [Chitinophagaceae bacterium]